jgi:hypothetical protein
MYTAHPTSVYPGSVLGVITDLTTIRENGYLKLMTYCNWKDTIFKDKSHHLYDETVEV